MALVTLELRIALLVQESKAREIETNI